MPTHPPSPPVKGDCSDSCPLMEWSKPGQQPPPLTSGQKFKLAAQYLNPYTFVFVAAEAGINQARNQPQGLWPGRGGLWQTLWRRLGGRFNRRPFRYRRVSVTVAPGSALLPPRGRRLLPPGGICDHPHSGDAAGFRTKGVQFLGGLGQFFFLGSGRDLLSQSERDFPDVAERAGIQFAFDAGFNLLKEFYPEIRTQDFPPEALAIAPAPQPKSP